MYLTLEIRTKGKTKTIYLTTDCRAALLEASEFAQTVHREMEELGKMQRTIFVTKEAKDEKVKP